MPQHLGRSTHAGGCGPLWPHGAEWFTGPVGYRPEGGLSLDAGGKSRFHYLYSLPGLRPSRQYRETGYPVGSSPSIDYNLWLGPAPDEPIYREELHYDWHWDWNTGNGDTGNQGVHELDLVRSVLGDPGHPRSVFSYGGRFAWNDGGNTPNMQNAVFDWGDGIPVLFELRDMWATPKYEAASHFRGHRFGIVVECEGGEFRGGRGGGSVYDHNGDRMKAFKGDGGFDHFPAFIRSVRSRKETDLGCTLKAGYLSTCLCHQANIAMRAGRTASSAEVSHAIDGNHRLVESHHRLVKHLSEWDIDFDKERWVLGRRLEFSDDRERFVGEGSEEANRFLKRRYRKGWRQWRE